MYQRGQHCPFVCNMRFLSQVSPLSRWHPETAWETLNRLSPFQSKTVYRIELSSSNLFIWRQVPCRSMGSSRVEFFLSEPFFRSWFHHVMQSRGVIVSLTRSVQRQVFHREVETSYHPWLLDRHVHVPTHLCLQQISPGWMQSFSGRRCQSEAWEMEATLPWLQKSHWSMWKGYNLGNL